VVRSRAGIAALAVAALAPATAWAYEEPSDSKKDLGRVEAAAGDDVRFELEGTDEGAKWAARIADDRQLADGEDTTEEPGTQATFTVPDLGDEERDVPVGIEVRHDGEGGDWELTLTLAYRPAAPAESQPPPESKPVSRPASTPPPAPVPPQPAANRSAPPAVPAPYSPAPSESSPPSSREPATDAPSAGRVLGQAQARVPRLRDLATASLQRSPERRKPARRPRRHRRTVNQFEVGPDPKPVHGRDVQQPRDTRVDLSDDSFPGLGWKVAWNLFVAVIIGGLLLPFLIALRTRRRRRRQAEIEAELQEMVAEHRTRELTRR
jgi:hypothetical protein